VLSSHHLGTIRVTLDHWSCVAATHLVIQSRAANLEAEATAAEAVYVAPHARPRWRLAYGCMICSWGCSCLASLPSNCRHRPTAT